MAMLPAEGRDALIAAGLSADDVARWGAATPDWSGSDTAGGDVLARDAVVAAAYYALGDGLLGGLPPKPQRTEGEQAAAEQVVERLRATRTRFLRAHAEPVYASLTDGYRA